VKVVKGVKVVKDVKVVKGVKARLLTSDFLLLT
jgi:hypothetical protein